MPSSITAGPREPAPCRVLPARLESVGRNSSTHEPDGRSGNHDCWKRHLEGEHSNKSRHRDAPQPAVPEGTRADTPGGVQHDGCNCRLDAVEQCGHDRHITKAHIDPGQADHHEQGRQNEQRSGDDPSPSAMQEPADIGGELLRLRPREQHAVVERMQETLLADPVPALDQLGMHDGDLARRPAKTDEAQLQPEPHGLAKTHLPRKSRYRYGRGGGLVGLQGVHGHRSEEDSEACITHG